MNRRVLASLLLLAGVAYACGPRARSAELERRKVVDGPPIVAVLDVKIRDGIEFAFRVTNNATVNRHLIVPTQRHLKVSTR